MGFSISNTYPHPCVHETPYKETIMHRLLISLLAATLLAVALPVRTLAAAPALFLTCGPVPAGYSIACRLSGSGFQAGEHLRISYRMTFSGSDPVQAWNRSGSAGGDGSFIRPQLAFDIRSGQSYRVSVSVTGDAGSRAATGTSGQYTAPPSAGKRIVVSLSQQRLYAYAGQRVVYTSVVTTGNPSLPTPLGRYHIFAKYHPYRFVSPWPVGSPYWYAPSWSSYAMQFRADGYFIHDAPWRSVFGPGSNGAGRPGTDYGGTHGCVNAPDSTAQFLYNWAPAGTEVDIVR
jgi:hypothetical protein